jgi:hypothetical protein
MKLAIAAALAVIAAHSLQAQTVLPTSASALDFRFATPLPGDWTYALAAGGSEASFLDGSSHAQLFVRCTRASRQVTIAKTATAAAPFIFVWTTSQSRNLPASYNPATYRLSATIPAFDPLLDAMAFSRGRIALNVSGQSALVAPAWEELARVIEDCRA